MALKDKLTAEVDDVLKMAWDIRDGQVVPETGDVALSNGAVRLNAVYVYADLADSTTLARDFDKRTAARAVRSYLSVMSRLVTYHSGKIRSFDGDRVMGIFIGGSKATNAAKCCLRMNWAFRDIIRPKFEAKYPGVKGKGYTLEHSAGADLGEVLIVRAGVRGSNDLVSIGAAPNIAASLSDRRESPYRSFVSAPVYDLMANDVKTANGKNMWKWKKINIKGKEVLIYQSSYYWSVG